MTIERRGGGDIERRVTSGQIEVRAEEAGKATTLKGYGAKFGVRSEDLGGFFEQIAPGAFDETIRSDRDVLARGEHDSRMLLGRRSNGTLRLSIDSVGLRYEIDPPDTTVGRDLVTLISRGDITQSSFAFFVESREDEAWSTTEDGTPLRTLKRVSLVDVAPVASPAYLQTTVSARALDTAKGVEKPMTAAAAKPDFARAKESRLFRHLTVEQRDASYEEKLEKLWMALYALLGSPWADCSGYQANWYVEATFDDHVIIERGYQFLSYPLSWADNGAPVFGEPTAVEIQYVPKVAAATGEAVPAGGVGVAGAVLPATDEYDSLQGTNEARQKLAEIEEVA